MKTIIKLSPILIFGVLFYSCGQIAESIVEDAYQEDLEAYDPSAEVQKGTTVEINNQYSIVLPDYMKEAFDLNDEASLQYQNIYKETYIIIIDEPSDTIVDLFSELGEYDESLTLCQNYRNIQLQMLTEGMTIQSESDPSPFVINGMDAESVEITATVEGVPVGITYFLTFVDGGKHVYMIMAWTLESRKDKYRDDFAEMANSFQIFPSEASEVDTVTLE